MKTALDRRKQGSYILLVEMPQEQCIRVGALGTLNFHRGFYAYVGSAMGGLQGRLKRHLGRKKRVRWHIDYLVGEGRVTGVIYVPTAKRIECQLAQRLGEIFRPVPGFGSSDCRCLSHLFFSEGFRDLQEGAEAILKDLLRGRSLSLICTNEEVP